MSWPPSCRAPWSRTSRPSAPAAAASNSRTASPKASPPEPRQPSPPASARKPSRPSSASRRRPPRPASCGWYPGRPAPRMTGTTTSSTSSATSPWPTCCAPPEPACGPWSTSSATPPSAPPTTRARPPASTRSASSPPRSARPAKRPAGIGDIGTTTYRAPFTPVAFAALAGRQRGELFDPARVTSIHPWHVAQGALFEDVGQWKRPWYYPQASEDMDAAVLRECAAVRESVGFMDATTLGKIEIRGKDAGEFLNRIYTNAFKKLAPGFRPLRRDVHGRRHDLRRRRDPAPRRGPVLHDHHHRRRREGAGLAGGMAADRMAGTGRALHLGDRTVEHHCRRRAQIPRGARQGGTANSPPTAGWKPKPSRS